MKRVLVTGATGFIGSHLTNSLEKENVEVFAVARSVPKKQKGNVAFFPVDLVTIDGLRKLPKNIDTIFHCAAFIPSDKADKYLSDCLTGNVVATAHLLNWAVSNNVKQFVHSSSIAVYGTVTKGKIDESFRPNPTTVYGLSKKLADDVVGYFSRQIITTILRYPSVYGPGMKDNTILPKLIDLAKKGQTITIHGSGSRTQDFIFVADVVAANLGAARKRVPGLFLIGSGRQTSLSTLAKAIIRVANSQSAITTDPTKPDDQQRICFNYQKAGQTFGFLPAYDLTKGLQTML